MAGGSIIRGSVDRVPLHRGVLQHLTQGRDVNESVEKKASVVLSAQDKVRGFVRPLRLSYIHSTCGSVTTMSDVIAETYARDPKYYDGTYCVGCSMHLPVSQFTWVDTVDTGIVVGT